MSKSIKLNVPGQAGLELPVLEASIGHDVVDIRGLTKIQVCFPSTPDLFQPQAVSLKLLTSTAIKACFIIADTPSSSWPKSPIIWKSATC